MDSILIRSPLCVKYSSLFYPECSRHLSIVSIVVCMRPSQPHNSSRPSSPLWYPYFCSLCLCLCFCFANKVIYTIFLDSTYLCGFSLSDLLHSVRQSPDPPTSLQITQFCPFCGWVIFYSISTPHLLYPFSADGHLGCFHVVVTVNSSGMNIEVHVSFWIMCLFFFFFCEVFMRGWVLGKPLVCLGDSKCWVMIRAHGDL